jgi:tetratricopeptide (TPR) repeat protein
MPALDEREKPSYTWTMADQNNDKDTEIARALGFFRGGEFEEALECADAIIAKSPENGLSWRFKGECLFSLGRFDDAISSFEAAAARSGEGTQDMFLWISLCHANAGRIPQAKEVLNHYIKIAPDAAPDLIARAQKALETLGAL